MKEFIEKLIGRLEEETYDMEICEKQFDMNSPYFIDVEYKMVKFDDAKTIVNQLAEEYNNSNDSMEIQIAKNYAKWLTKCGVNVTEKWLTATEQTYALNKAYMRGRQDEGDKFARWQEEHKDNVMIDGQYCWQTCSATEHCKECNRLCNGSIDYYENYDVLAEEQGLLLRLPCKVGDTIWFVGNDFVNDYEIRRYLVDETGIDCVQVAKEIDGREYWNSFSIDYIGKTVFLTQEEAEQALAEMKGV